ncbi:MAG TPA: MFS transporter [Opitutaceae bacterium]|nr:MFS transporter [Opitutaceae bacterium]
MSSPAPTPPRPLSLGVIFLTLYIDLIGFSIAFPLGPDLLRHYLSVDGQSGVLASLLGALNSFAHILGNESHLPEVLFGGLISSLFSVLQFVFAPFWGSLSDKRGRRPILLFTVAGTALSYALWMVSGSFWLFIVSRLIAGAFGGNLSVATAAVADVTTRQERSKAMGLVGAAFGLGLVTGPLLGAFSVQFNVVEHYPALAEWGFNPFSFPAFLAMVMSLLNLVWIAARFKETLPERARGESREPRLRNPLRALLSLGNREIRRINLVAFIYSLAFVAMEVSLTFLAAERFNYTAVENGKLMGFLGICSIITQGFIVRKMLGKIPETQVLKLGLLGSLIGLLALGFASSPLWLYAGVAFLAFGSGLVNPSSSGLISLYAGESEQGRVLGLFRSLGALSRAVTPVTAGIIFWTLGSTTVFVVAAILAVLAFLASRRLPQPAK